MEHLAGHPPSYFQRVPPTYPNGEWRNYDQYGNLVTIGRYVGGVPEGEWTEFDTNGSIWMRCAYRDGRLNGELREYNHDGTLAKVCNYVNGVREGPITLYFPSDRCERGQYHNDEPVGVWITYHHDLAIDQIDFGGM
jgi:antitoxin component YwqK of YwqJK toxin-antitoxin module